jgi:prepilin-type N-terminal cleavage/methylation domain-containing protein
MKATRHDDRRPGATGFSLIEMSLAMALIGGLMVALLLMLNLHLTFLGMVRGQDFLLREAPQVGGLLNRLLTQVDHFFIYADASAAANPEAVPVEEGTAVKLFFRRPGGDTVMRTLVFETGTSRSRGTLRMTSAENPPGWPVSRAASGVTFLVEDGLLKVRLRGPRGEELTYTGGGR